VAIDIDLGVTYYALIFACCELGLVLTNVWPSMIHDQDPYDDRLAIIGGVDMVICKQAQHDPTRADYNSANHKRDLTYSKKIIYEHEFVDYEIPNPALFEQISNTVWATPDTVLTIGCSSGTTGDPKKISDTHKKVYRMAQRYAPRYSAGKRVLHSAHHHVGLSGPMYLLPGFMFGTDQFTHELEPADLQQLVDTVIENKINHLYCYNAPILLKFLQLVPRLEHDLRIFTLVRITKVVAELLQEKNVELLMTAFGDSTIGHAFFLKRIDRHTDLSAYDDSNQGAPVDDFYAFEIRNGLLYTSIPQLTQDWNTSKDLFEIKHGDYCCLGRSDDYEINGESFSLKTLEQQVSEFFGEGANVFFDADRQKLYLAVWEKNDEAEKQLNNFLQQTYQFISISAVLRNVDIIEFYNDRKIDSAKVRRICRTILEGVQ
jgi:acyl-coenzyme A synthetase/AMP-(fatty) acid ligase